MSKSRKKYEAVSSGSVNLFEEVVLQDEAPMTDEAPVTDVQQDEAPVTDEAPMTDVQQDDEEKPTLGYTDWSVAKALGVKRRRLVRLRQTGKAMRDIDWTCINGEVCMTHQWCSLHVPQNKLSLLSLAGVDGLVTFEVHDFVQNPHMVIGRRLDNNTLEIIHIANHRDYHKGMQFEARRRTGGGYTVAYRIPRSDY